MRQAYRGMQHNLFSMFRCLSLGIWRPVHHMLMAPDVKPIPMPKFLWVCLLRTRYSESIDAPNDRIYKPFIASLVGGLTCVMTAPEALRILQGPRDSPPPAVVRLQVGEPDDQGLPDPEAPGSHRSVTAPADTSSPSRHRMPRASRDARLEPSHQ